MHGRTLLGIALMTVFGLSAPAADAATMPAGTYDVTLTGGTLKIGTLLPPMALPALGSFSVTLSDQPASVSLTDVTVAPIPVSLTGPGATATGEITPTITNASATVNPSAGSATIDGTFSASGTISGTLLLVPFSVTCSIAPTTVHLSTASPGAPWDATTNGFSLADNTFALPTISCGDPTVQGLIAALLGDTSSGNNSATATGTATPRPDTQTGAPPTTPSPPPGSTDQPTAPAGTTVPTGTNGSTTAGCVVPKLKGKRVASKKALRKTRSRLTKTHCRLGKVKKVKSKKRKGTVLKQKPAPGKRLPAGTRINLVVSRGA